MKEKLHFDCLDTRLFKYLFEGQDVTLMSAHALRKEFALLRKACKPLPMKDRLQRPAFLDDHVRLAVWLKDLLPASPGAVETVRDSLVPLPPSEKWLLLDALKTVQDHLRACPNPAPLFLVPARWPARMEQILDVGTLYPAQIGFWSLSAPRLPDSLRENSPPSSHLPPSILAAALLDAPVHMVSSHRSKK